ncbi:hypothetical protein C0J52_16914 [Blattella germanica]|nr:hypothetical protein C0J52_16914 [Blattella germanica]
MFEITEQPLLTKCLVPRINCWPARRILTILGSKSTLNNCRRLSFWEQNHTISMLGTCESSHFDMNYASACSDRTRY